MKAYINVALYWSRNQLRRSEILQDPHFQLPKLEANMKSASFINFDPKNGNNFEKWRIQEFLFGVGGGVQQIPFRTDDRQNGDLGTVTP